MAVAVGLSEPPYERQSTGQEWITLLRTKAQRCSASLETTAKAKANL